MRTTSAVSSSLMDWIALLFAPLEDMDRPTTPDRNQSRRPARGLPGDPISSVCHNSARGICEVKGNLSTNINHEIVFVTSQSRFHAQHRCRRGILQTEAFLNHRQRHCQSRRLVEESSQQIEHQRSQLQLQVCGRRQSKQFLSFLFRLKAFDVKFSRSLIFPFINNTLLNFLPVTFTSMKATTSAKSRAAVTQIQLHTKYHSEGPQKSISQQQFRFKFDEIEALIDFPRENFKRFFDCRPGSERSFKGSGSRASMMKERESR